MKNSRYANLYPVYKKGKMNLPQWIKEMED